MISKNKLPSNLLVVLLFSFSLSLSAQIKENTPLPPFEAEPLIVEDWGAKRKTMKNFTIDLLRVESVNLILDQKIPEISRITIYKGKQADGTEIILAVGVDDKGNAFGNYFMTSFTNRVGPCPDSCD